jgi:phosphomannomutase
MVTASHNPRDWNGFKLFLGDGTTISEGAGMEEVRDAVLRGAFTPTGRKGSVSKANLAEAYVEHGGLEGCG